MNGAVKRSVLLVDGGHLRIQARKAGLGYNPDFIEAFSRRTVEEGEELVRILYYDCMPYEGTHSLPISNEPKRFNQSGKWLEDLAARELLAVRYGVLKWRGWRFRKDRGIPRDRPLVDSDFEPDIEQKGVDLRIGLDMAEIAAGRIYDRVMLVSADTDLIPAMKIVRRAGIQMVIAELPNWSLHRELAAHVDLRRRVDWPQQAPME
jgi:uncharacterized LabA/DUF88 family protein